MGCSEPVSSEGALVHLRRTVPFMGPLSFLAPLFLAKDGDAFFSPI